MATPLTRGHARQNAWFAYVGAAVALTGVQMISPALPVMRDELVLSATQLGLVMSVYLLPATLFSIPAGWFADRVGRRLVFGWAFVGFGVCGLVLPFVSTWWSVFLAVRFTQGLMFAGLLPLTMTILGDAFTGPGLVAAQGRRSVAMSLGDGILPVIGGLLVAAGWFVPWLGQVVAIPFGIVVLMRLVDPPSFAVSQSEKRGLKDLLIVFKRVAIVGLQYMGFLRMFLKFSILTFLPLFVVDLRSFSPAFAGVLLGLASGSGAVVAAAAGWFGRRSQPVIWIGLGVLIMGVALLGLVSVADAWLMMLCAVAYGVGDGLMGVFTNAIVTAATEVRLRASFVAATGAIRNLAKLAAPVIFGTAVAVFGLLSSFQVLGVVAAVSALVALSIRPLQGTVAATSGAAL